MTFREFVDKAMMWLKQLILTVIAILWEIAVISCLGVYYYVEAIVLFFTPTFLHPMKNLRNKVVLITGGAGVLGQQLALRLARQKARIVLWDINETGLEKAKEMLENEGHKAVTYVVDLADRKNVYKNADLVKSEIGPVDILINNAGIVCGNNFLDIPDEMVEKTFKINIISHYWTVKAFLGDMLKRGKGHIVTTGSATGLMGTYKCTDYSATKFAAVGFHESLLTELKAHGHDNIHMTMICPYFINTGMFAGAKPTTMPMLEPKDVAKRMILAIRREEEFCTVPDAGRYFFPLKYYIPTKFWWVLVHRVFRAPQAMMGLRKFEVKTEVPAA